MHVTMYCYSNLLCIYYHYMNHCLADGDIHVSVMCIRQEELTAQRGIGSIHIPQPSQAGALY